MSLKYFKDFPKKSQDMWQRMGTAMMKIAQYRNDPDVKKAQDRLEKIME